MDLLARARVLAACRLFAELAPPVVIRLAERARGRELATGERAAVDAVSVIASGRVRVGDRVATAGHVLGMVAVVVRARGAPPAAGIAASIGPGGPGGSRSTSGATGAIADEPSAIVELAVDDVRDVLEEDPGALAALVEALAAQLLDERAS